MSFVLFLPMFMHSSLVVYGRTTLYILHNSCDFWVNDQISLGDFVFLVSPIAFFTYRLMRSNRLLSSISCMELSNDVLSSKPVIISYFVSSLAKIWVLSQSSKNTDRIYWRSTTLKSLTLRGIA